MGFETTNVTTMKELIHAIMKDFNVATLLYVTTTNDLINVNMKDSNVATVCLIIRVHPRNGHHSPIPKCNPRSQHNHEHFVRSCQLQIGPVKRHRKDVQNLPRNGKLSRRDRFLSKRSALVNECHLLVHEASNRTTPLKNMKVNGNDYPIYYGK